MGAPSSSEQTPAGRRLRGTETRPPSRRSFPSRPVSRPRRSYTDGCMVDLREHTGRFFFLLGVILIGVAFLQPGNRAPLSEANVNLWSGLLMLAFGLLLLGLARRAKS